MYMQNIVCRISLTFIILILDFNNPTFKFWGGVGLTHKKIWNCQIEEVVIALSSQTLVHFKGQNNECIAQNYHNNQSNHHHHQNDKNGSWKDEVALDSTWDIVKKVPTGVIISLFLRHGPGVRWTMRSLNPQ